MTTTHANIVRLSAPRNVDAIPAGDKPNGSLDIVELDVRPGWYEIDACVPEHIAQEILALFHKLERRTH